MKATSNIRRARKQRICSEHSYHVIKAGDLYLDQVAAPWHDANDSGKWWRIACCLKCAEKKCLMDDETRSQLHARQNPGDATYDIGADAVAAAGRAGDGESVSGPADVQGL